MNNQEIINQLKAILPRYTGDFTANYNIISLTRSGSVVTATTDIDHELLVNDKVLIVNAKTPISITSLTRVGKYVTAITASGHSLLRNQISTEIAGADQSDYNGVKNLVWKTPIIDIESITILGTTATVTTKTPHGLVFDSNIELNITSANGNYSGKITLDSVPSSTTFTYTVYGESNDATPIAGKLMQMQLILNSRVFMFEVSGAPTTPATGTIYQLTQYKNGYNGYKTITSVPTTTTFTYSISETPNSPAQGTIEARIFPTITGSIDLERAKKFYESAVESGQSNKWIICVLDNEIVSKNILTTTDSSSITLESQNIRESAYQNINIYIFLPCGSTNDELLYILTRDAGESYKPYIYKALLGFKPSSSLTQNSYSKLIPLGNGAQEFNGSYYIHYFSFQATGWINETDAIDPDDLFAFRTFDIDVIDNENFDTSIMEIKGDVDES